LAVVKLENKLPVSFEKFDEIDEAVCNNFTRQVLLDLLNARGKKPPPVDGLLFLTTTLGPPPPAQEATEQHYKNVYALHVKNPKIVTVRVACSYLKVKKSTWHYHANRLKDAPQQSK
jgi:hypothetical protein